MEGNGNLKKPREKICAYCKSFTFKARSQRGQAFCLKKNDWLPNQTLVDVPEDLRDHWVAPGERTCKKWS